MDAGAGATGNLARPGHERRIPTGCAVSTSFIGPLLYYVAAVMPAVATFGLAGRCKIVCVSLPGQGSSDQERGFELTVDVSLSTDGGALTPRGIAFLRSLGVDLDAERDRAAKRSDGRIACHPSLSRSERQLLVAGGCALHFVNGASHGR